MPNGYSMGCLANQEMDSGKEKLGLVPALWERGIVLLGFIRLHKEAGHYRAVSEKVSSYSKECPHDLFTNLAL